MKMKLFGLLAAGTALFVGANAYALSVAAGATGYANATANSVVGATATGSANAQASGTTGLQVNAGLQAEVESGSVATSSVSANAIVQLQGGSLGLIQTNDDLTAYNSLVVKARPAVKNINVNTDGSMSISYSQPAKFLGMFNTSITSNVNIDAQGNVMVSKPWYGFLYAADTTPVQASVATAVQQSGAPLGAQVSATATMQSALQDKAVLVNAITAAIQAEAQASSTTSASVY